MISFVLGIWDHNISHYWGPALLEKALLRHPLGEECGLGPRKLLPILDANPHDVDPM